MSEHTPQPEATRPNPAVLLAGFPSAERLKAAAAEVRDAGYRRWDTHSPFPIHGMERAMGLRPTILPWLVMAAGLTGCVAALLLQWWTGAIDYPLIISGKPLFSLPANIPVTFEAIVLLSAITTFGGALVLNLLPAYGHPVFRSERFRRATADGFFLSIDVADPQYSEADARALLERIGGEHVERLESLPPLKVPLLVKWMAALVLLMACLPPLFVAWYRSVPHREPRIHPVLDMDFQPKYLAQAHSPFFEDGRTMRLPVEGTVAQDGLDADEHLHDGRIDGDWATTFPMPVTMQLAERGRERFNIYCAACHGLTGDGQSVMNNRALERDDTVGPPPTSMYTQLVIEQPVGQIYNTVKNGYKTMPGYAAQIPVDDRWAIVLYVRALQRSRDASADEVPQNIRERLN